MHSKLWLGILAESGEKGLHRCSEGNSEIFFNDQELRDEMYPQYGGAISTIGYVNPEMIISDKREYLKEKT